MGNLSHTVGGNANLVSFKSAARVPITSAKCEFLPIQEGEGTPSPENIRPISGWQNVDVYQSDEQLPVEYQKVEYLQSYGTEYIDTLISLGTDDFEIELDFSEVENTYQEQAITSIWTSTYNYWNLFIQKQNDTTYKIDVYANGHHLGKIILLNKKEHLIFKKDSNTWTCTVGEESFSYNQTISSNKINNTTLKIFRRGDIPATTYSNTHIKMYHYKLIQASQLVRNLIPCRRISDNKPGMYDTVSQIFFTNQGTGEFICGPDVGQAFNVEFPAIGKNLLNKNNYGFKAYDSLTFGGSNSSARPDGTLILDSGTYTLSVNTTMDVMGMVHENGQQGALVTNTNQMTFTCTSKEAVRFIIMLNGQSSDHDMLQYNYQLEAGDTATEYEPFDNTVYGGNIDIITGQINRTHRVFTRNGTTETANFAFMGSGVYGAGFNYNYKDTPPNDITGFVISDKLPVYTTHGAAPPYIYIMPAGGTAIAVIFIIGYTSDSNYQDNNTWVKAQTNAWLQNNNITICARNAITASKQAAPISLNTLLGQNYIWSNTNSNTEVSYAVHDSAPIRATRAKIMANEPHIESISSNIANFSTDMIAPLKEAKVYFNPIQEGSGDPSPENIRPIIGHEKIDISQSNIYSEIISLPSEYQQVEYIKTAGPWIRNNMSDTKTYNSFICTDIRVDNIGKIICRYKIINYEKTGSYYPMFIASHTFGGTAPTVPYAAVGQIASFESMSPMGTPVIGEDNVYTITNTLNGGYYLRIGGWSDWQWTAEGAYYYVRVYDENNNKIAHFVPCYRKSDNKAGLYEIISETFFVSNGAEDFIAGPEVLGTIIPINWSSTVGSIYGGYIDLVNGELVQTMNTISLNQPELWKQYDTTRVYGYTGAISPNRLTGSQYNIISNIAPSSLDSVWKIKWTSSTSNYCGLYWGENDPLCTLAELKELSANNQIKVCYMLENPIHYQLSPIQLKALKSTNNIWSSANGSIELKYWTH